MSYIPLGSRKVTAAADTTGLNAGNLTNCFDQALLAVHVSYYEVYAIAVAGLAQVSTVTVYVNSQVRSSAKLLGAAEWDPNQPILMNDGDDLALAWDFTSAAEPTATIWLRYDPAIQPRRRS